MPERPAALSRLLASSRVKHIPKGQILLYEGDEPNEVFIVKTGIIKVYNIDVDGNEKILHLLSETALFPFLFFSGARRKSHWFYSALSDCDLYLVSQEKLRALTEQDCEVTLYLMHWFSEEVHELLVRLDSLGKTNVHDKLVSAIKFLVVQHSKKRRSGWWRVQFPVNHQLLADMIGMTRESTSSAMKELSDAGIIRNPRLTILEVDFEKLIA